MTLLISTLEWCPWRTWGRASWHQKKDLANIHTRMMSLKNLGKGFITSKRTLLISTLERCHWKTWGRASWHEQRTLLILTLKWCPWRTWGRAWKAWGQGLGRTAVSYSCLHSCPGIYHSPGSQWSQTSAMFKHSTAVIITCHISDKIMANTVVSLLFSKAIPLKYCPFLSPVFLLRL